MHSKYMKEALKEAKLALEEGEFPVGCIFVSGDQIIARGRRKNSSTTTRNEIDHAEIVTLRTLIRTQPDIDMGNVTVYTTLEPCLMCYSTMLLSGVRSFVWAYEDVMGGGTNVSLSTLHPLYAEMQVNLVDKILRKESLELFLHFFTHHSYWQDSLLSSYTLAQKK